MKKRIVSVVCVLAMLLSMATVLSLGAAASSGVNIVCSVIEQTETAVTVDVSVTNNAGFMYLEITPSYPAALEFTSVTNGGLISDFTKGNQYIWVGDDDTTATGTLCTLTFAIPEGTADGEYPISFVVQLCANMNEEEVPTTVTPCNITIGSAPEETTPEETTPEEPAPEEPTPVLPTAEASVVSYQVTKGETGEFSLRVIAGVNSLEYHYFGYEITLTTKDENGDDVEQTLAGLDRKVYRSVYGGEQSYSIKEHFGYEYAALATVTGLAADSEYTKLEIRTYVVLDGEKLYGEGMTLLYTGVMNDEGYPELSIEK